MESINSSCRTFFLACSVSFFTAACSTHQKPAANLRSDKSANALFSASEPLGVLFKAGRPRVGESLEVALEKPQSFYLSVLRRDIELLSSLSGNVKYRVVGNTDNLECSPSDCAALSLRRAALVDAWVRAHGVSAAVLSAPIGYGSTRPLAFNDSADGREKNRIAFFEPVTP